MPEQATADIGLIGLAVMGENLALNTADHGFKCAVYNRTTETMRKFVAREKHPNLIPCETMKQLVAAIKRPRKFIILVKAGPAVDAVTKELIDAGIAADDIVVDCGNSLWTDTIRRERDYAAKCKFFGSGVSGGEVGARFGPSMMLDAAGQKGTGKWTSVNALDMGIPANAISEAVFARCLSALKEERVDASKKLVGPSAKPHGGDRDELNNAVRDALYCSKICAYAQ